MAAGWSRESCCMISLSSAANCDEWQKFCICLGVGGITGSIIQGYKSTTCLLKIEPGACQSSGRGTSMWFRGCFFQASRTWQSGSAISLPSTTLLGPGRWKPGRGNKHAKSCCLMPENWPVWINETTVVRFRGEDTILRSVHCFRLDSGRCIVNNGNY